MKTLLMTSMVFFAASFSYALETRGILADPAFLRALHIPILAEQQESQVAYAQIDSEMEERIQENAHLFGKCGGFEALKSTESLQDFRQIFADLKLQYRENLNYQNLPLKSLQVVAKPQIEEAIKQVSESNLQATVQWLSSFPNRFNKGSKPNEAVLAFKDRLQQMTAFSAYPITIELINHNSTQQKSIHLVIPGKTHPQESIVLGAHFDSINIHWGQTAAPGADDNASGSSNILEALRIILAQPQPERSIEFFWYAGEESGLLGSAEIAQHYKEQKKDVIAVLQLDMTLMPGEGAFTLASMSDFTSSWLRDYLRSANDTYLKVNIVEDQCGYGCSDHASWYRNGYPTLMPFEAKMSTMNPNIHGSGDVITPKLSFSHSAVFTKIALIMALDLGNSDLRQPYLTTVSSF